MINYIDKTPKFTRDQLIFIADVMIAAAVDAIDVAHPKNSGAPQNDFNQHVGGIINKISWDLSILYAQITDDGIGCSDVTAMLKLDDFLNDCCDSQRKRDAKTLTTKIATKYVDELFKDYLACFSQEEMQEKDN